MNMDKVTGVEVVSIPEMKEDLVEVSFSAEDSEVNLILTKDEALSLIVKLKGIFNIP
jgi:hypothetical protein